MKPILTILITTITCAAALAAPQNAERMLQSRMINPLLKCEGTITGEGVCWHAAYGMDRFMNAYRETKDTSYLDAAVKYYDALIAKMHTSPDGYKGWVGPYIYDRNYINDVHIGDAILIVHMLDFSETVLKRSDDKIKEAYSDKAQGYLELAKKHLIEKWDTRGTWHEDGPYGAYVSWDRYMTPDDLTDWRKLPATKSTLTLPFNKQNSMGIACLRIYRITGEEAYRGKALKIFNYMKSRMALYENHYIWNYWEPFGPWDIDKSAKNKLNHWVNVHPYRNYQAGEIHEIVEAYHSGLTFDKEDIQHIINTNIKVMWNGDRDNPQWRNSNYAVEVAALGEPSIEEAPGGEFPELAGTLWTGLLDFSETVRELSGRAFDTPVSFERKYSDLPVTVLDRPFHSNCYFTMATAIPAAPQKGKTVNLITQIRIGGKLAIELYSSDGEKKIADIRTKPAKDDRAGLVIVPWDTQNTPAGNYRIRWALNGEYREFPVEVE